MKRKGIDYYLIPLSDYHNSEYFSDYYNAIKYLSGFTGSNATLVVSLDSAYLWTDGRYFIQAEAELSGSGIILMKQGVKGVPKIEDFLDTNMGEEDTFCFDGRMVNVDIYERFNNTILKENPNRHMCDADIVSSIWINRGEPEAHELLILPEEYAGESVDMKIVRIRGDKNYKEADAVIVSDLCDIAWTLNMRGSDIEHMKVFYSYLIITNDDVIFYADKSRLTDHMPYLTKYDITVREYDDIYADLSSKGFYQSHGIYKILIDKSSLNTALYTILNSYTTVLSMRSIPSSLKCIKNDTEIKNIRNAHIKDAVAMCKFMYYLEKEVIETGDALQDGSTDKFKEGHSEISLAEVLYKFRSEQEGFIEESFPIISAWAENGAIVHYEPTEKTNKTIGRNNFLLVDSGGHYMEGTTDITRTFLIGEASAKMKRDYTLVLKSNISLATAKFLGGTGGKSLDMLPRNVMWKAGYDYLHGTGHGVGYLLSVHEGPNSISIRSREDVPIRPGMVTTDEPGLYLEGEYGIRLENELLCKPFSSGEYGEYYCFECLTFVPFDRKCIEKSMLTEEELDYINTYHKKIYDTISPYLSEDEQNWLYAITREL